MHDVLRDIAKKKLGMIEKKRMSAADIGAMLKLFNAMPTTISDLLMLADSIYSQCHAPPGTLIADDLDEIEEVVRIFQYCGEVLVYLQQ